MAQDYVYLGDMPDVVCDFKEDISTASARTMHVQKPDGQTETWSAAAGDAVTEIKYAIPTTLVLNQAGIWKVNPRVIVGGKQITGVTGEFEVRSLSN